MQAHNLPTLFDESGFTENEHTYLSQKELRIKSILMQSAGEVGCELDEVRQWFSDNHKWGYEAWVKEKFGYTPQHANRFIAIAKNLSDRIYMLDPDISFNAQLQLAKAPEPQAAVDEALLRKQIEGEITAKKA